MCLNFLRYFLLYFLASLMAFFRSIKIRILRDFQSVLTLMVDTFPSCKDLQSADQRSAVGQEGKYGYNHEDIVEHGQPFLLYSN